MNRTPPSDCKGEVRGRTSSLANAEHPSVPPQVAKLESDPRTPLFSPPSGQSLQSDRSSTLAGLGSVRLWTQQDDFNLLKGIVKSVQELSWRGAICHVRAGSRCHVWARRALQCWGHGLPAFSPLLRA